MSITYSAESLEDIAKAIDLLKSRARKRADEATTERRREYHTGRVDAFDEVAEMLRNTELRGF